MGAPSRSRDLATRILYGVMIFVLGLSIWSSFYFSQLTAKMLRSDLSGRAQTIARALDAREIERLSGSDADTANPAYAELKQKLARIKEVNQNARSLYLMGNRNGQLFFYVDSEDSQSTQFSPAGQLYFDGTSGLKEIFTNNRPLVEGPVSDDFGTFISGLAPVIDPTTQAVVAVIGIDISAAAYNQAIAKAAIIPLLLGLTLLLLLFFFTWSRRRDLQLLALRSELVSVASHELRSPLTGIRWAAESLQTMVKEKPASTMVTAIYESAAKLQASTDDILELSREMKLQGLTVESTNILDLMKEVVENQSLPAQKRSVTLKLTSSWSHDLEIRCDVDKMRRALQNIVSNAIKYTHEKSTVTLSYRRHDKFHEIIIADQGIGIPASEQSKVFGGFYRASNAKKSNVPGTGLGLYLVRTILEQHHGHVSFTSVENEGTTFTLSIPS